MTELHLVSNRDCHIKQIVEAALMNEMRLLKTGIKKTEMRLKFFEDKYQQRTYNFILTYEDDKFDESMDFIEWIGEFRLQKRLYEKIEILKGIRIAGGESNVISSVGCNLAEVIEEILRLVITEVS